jgi:hypothetical protein
MELNNKILLFCSIPVISGLIGKIIYGTKGMIYFFIGAWCIIIVGWAWKHGQE